MVTDGKERSWSDTWIDCGKHPHRAFPRSAEARPGGISRQNAKVRGERSSTRRCYGIEGVCELLCKGKHMEHGAGMRWCARCYRPSHPRPCSSYPDQGTLDWHLPTLPIWGRGSLVPFRIWPGVLIPAHDLPQRRRRVLFFVWTCLCAGASLKATREDFVKGLGTGTPSQGCSYRGFVKWINYSVIISQRSRRNRTAATGRRVLGQVEVPRKEKTGLKANIETFRTQSGLVISPSRAGLVGAFTR